MIRFFKGNAIYAVGCEKELTLNDIQKLSWLFGGAAYIEARSISGFFIGPRREMVTPWSTNAVEITQNMGVTGIFRIEEYVEVKGADAPYDAMLQVLNHNLDQDIFTVLHEPDPVQEITDIAAYNLQEGLALSKDEIEYLNELSRKSADLSLTVRYLASPRLIRSIAGIKFSTVPLCWMAGKCRRPCSR